jgi:ADP-ribose pyrophosphatase YjhB (NUDIX family)
LRKFASIVSTAKKESFMKLDTVSTEVLAAELRSRADLLDAQGIMPLEVYKLVEQIQPIPCVDGVAVRRNEDRHIEAMAIRRGTRRFKGKLCSIGGRIRYKESAADCLSRQFRTDVGCEIKMLTDWSRPVTASQCAPVKEGEEPPQDFDPEEGRHTTSNYYPVQLLSEPTRFGITAFAGQEALSVEWYTLKNLPPSEEFGYGQRPKFVACMQAAEMLI